MHWWAVYASEFLSHYNKLQHLAPFTAFTNACCHSEASLQGLYLENKPDEQPKTQPALQHPSQPRMLCTPAWNGHP